MKTNKKKGEQTETQILGNCWHYFKTRFDKFWKGLRRKMDEQDDFVIEELIEEIAAKMTGDLTFANWKRAVDEAYPV